MNIENIWTGVNEADKGQPWNAPSHTFFPFAKAGNMIVLNCRMRKDKKYSRNLSKMTIQQLGVSK